jgi:hypothetical protein
VLLLLIVLVIGPVDHEQEHSAGQQNEPEIVAA